MSPADRPQHYFDAAPTAKSDRGSVDLVLPDVSLRFATDSGVFAKSRIDPGSKLLLLDGPRQTADDQHLADIGAGYGPIAITLAKRNPEAVIWAIEINSRARDLCVENAAAAGVSNVKVVGPDEVPADVVFDRVWSNPPIRIGKPELQGLLVRWLSHLAPTGSAHLVVQKHLGSDSLHRWLEQQGWPTTRRASRAGYRLLDVAARTGSDGPSPSQPPEEEQ